MRIHTDTISFVLSLLVCTKPKKKKKPSLNVLQTAQVHFCKSLKTHNLSFKNSHNSTAWENVNQCTVSSLQEKSLTACLLTMLMGNRLAFTVLLWLLIKPGSTSYYKLTIIVQLLESNFMSTNSFPFPTDFIIRLERFSTRKHCGSNYIFLFQTLLFIFLVWIKIHKPRCKTAK